MILSRDLLNHGGLNLLHMILLVVLGRLLILRLIIVTLRAIASHYGAGYLFRHHILILICLSLRIIISLHHEVLRHLNRRGHHLRIEILRSLLSLLITLTTTTILHSWFLKISMFLSWEIMNLGLILFPSFLTTLWSLAVLRNEFS